MWLVEVLRLRAGCLRWVGMALFWVFIPLHAQDDTANQGVELMRAGKFHDAEAVWRQLEKRFPNNPEIHSNLGVSLAQQGQFEPAATEYRKSLALSPKQPEVAYDLGLAEFKQGHFTQAISAFKTAARLKPEDTRSTLLMGMSYYGSRQYSLAKPYLQQASRNDPSNLELHNVLAQSCLWSHQYDCALGEFKSILSANPDAVQAHMLLAEALDGMGKTEDAIKELDTAATLSRMNLFSTSNWDTCTSKKEITTRPFRNCSKRSRTIPAMPRLTCTWAISRCAATTMRMPSL